MASRGRSSNSNGGSRGGFGGGRPHGVGFHHGGSSVSDFVISAFVAKKLFDGGVSQGESGEDYSVPRYKAVRNKVATAIVSGILFAITIALTLCAIFYVDVVYGKVMGTVESYEVRYEFGETYYYTNYQYTVKDKTYSAESGAGWTKLPESAETYVGSTYELYYKRTNPYVIYEIEDKENLPETWIVFMVLGLFSLSFGILVYKNGINKYVENPQWKKEQEERKQKQSLGGKSKCDYCGTLVGDGKDKCPSCGASIK